MRAMKKMLISAAACGVLAAAVSASALCAQITVESGATYAQDSSGNYTVSVDASKMLTQNSGQMTVMVTKVGALEKGLKNDDILYIDQVASATGIFQNMGVKGKLKAGETYDVFVGGSDVKSGNEAAFYRTSFTVASADTHTVLLGDLDKNGVFTSTDAVIILEASVNNAAGLTTDQKIACDCDQNGAITSSDAVMVLEASAGINKDLLVSVEVDNATGEVIKK